MRKTISYDLHDLYMSASAPSKVALLDLSQCSRDAQRIFQDLLRHHRSGNQSQQCNGHSGDASLPNT